MPRWLRRTLLALLLLAVFAHFARQTKAPLLPPGVTKENLTLELAGQSVSVSLYHPAKDENAPLVVVAHGFLRSKRYMAGWGAHLAGAGFLVAVPTQPSLANHDVNGRVLAELVQKYRGKRYVGLVGFSMGGLTT